MKILIEIKAGEGGKDAQLLVPRQASVYEAYACQHSLAYRLVDSGLG